MTKKEEWNRSYHGVGIKLEPQVVRIANDFVLDVHLQENSKNCMRLAREIRNAYELEYQEQLRISERSLAIEIYAHYKIQKLSEKVERYLGRTRLTRWLIGHTEVIDCGCREKDNNRFIWDTLCAFTVLEDRIRGRRDKN
ncbi:MAG: hypothetical protein Q4B85_07385 [Lachnospiraceae bacterium]|nr:hypothetical protein [Lachnospiraceae bacterium]